MNHKVTPYFPMKQVFGTPKCKKIHRLPLDLVVRLERKPTRADFLCRQLRGHTKYLPNNSLGDLKSLPRKSEIHRKVEIKLRKNEMKLRKKDFKVPRNLPIAPWRFSISSGETSIWAHLSPYSIQNLTNRREESWQASNDRCWTFTLLWYTTDYRLFGIAVLRITLYLCTV